MAHTGSSAADNRAFQIVIKTPNLAQILFRYFSFKNHVGQLKFKIDPHFLILPSHTPFTAHTQNTEKRSESNCSYLDFF